MDVICSWASLVVVTLVASLHCWVIVRSVVRVVLRMLLAVDEGYAVHVVGRMVIVLVPAHDEFLLCSL